MALPMGGGSQQSGGMYWGNTYVPGMQYGGGKALQSPVSPMSSQYTNPFAGGPQMTQGPSQYSYGQSQPQYAPGQEPINGGAQNQGIQRYAPLAGLGMETLGAMSGYAALGQKSPAQQQYERNTAMLSNPNDPRLKEMIGAEANARQGDFLKSLREFRLADQRSRAQGKGAIMGGERQDENLFNSIRQGMEMSQKAGREAAYGRLADQQNYLPSSVTEQNRLNEAKRQGKLGQTATMGEFLKKYPLVESGIFGGKPVAGGSPSAENVNMFRGGYGLGMF